MINLVLLDQEIEKLLLKEQCRQNNQINLIASENICDERIYRLNLNLLNNKYAEGIANNRFYAGCKYIDEIELLAKDRVCKLFNCEYANLQPHSGTQSNIAAILAVCSNFKKEYKPKILSMDFNAGGHLSHGHNLSIISKIANIITYNVSKETELIDYNELEEIAIKEKPDIIISGASSYSRFIDYKIFYEISKKVNSVHISDIAHIAGLIAAKLHPSPVEFADIITGTTHKTLKGVRGGFILSKKEYSEKIEKAIMPGIQGGPIVSQIAGKASTFFYALQDDFILYQKNIINNAQILSNIIQSSGYKIVSNGTDNHLFVIDLSNKNITGLEAEKALEKEGIIVNKNAIPYDKLPPKVASGIRIGTPFITSQNKTKNEIVQIALNIKNILDKCK